MRLLSIILTALLLNSSLVWENDLEVAKQKAQDQHKHILVSFSGSDWCIPCIKMEKEIFESADFNSFAEANLVLVKADFPRLKKNKLSKEQEKRNEKLADKYNPSGSFPLTLLLDENGKVLRTWEGYPEVNGTQFVSQISTALNGNN
jgi:thioredoxin-related protein